jgi:hypothetical protein
MAEPHSAERPESVEPKTLASDAPREQRLDPSPDTAHPGTHQGYQESQHGGLEVAASEAQPGLEAVEARPGLSSRKTWEKHSTLPEATGRPPQARAFSYMNPDLDYRATTGASQRPWAGRDGLVCGMRRHTFYMVAVICVFAVLAAVALGLGLGLGLHRNSSSTPSSTASNIPSSTAMPSASSVSLPAPTATATLGAEVDVVCADNLTLYSVPNTTPAQSFLFMCGRDYAAKDGAVDLMNKNVSDFTTCLNMCVDQEGCVGASWGAVKGVNKCWLKASLGNVSWSEGWHIGVQDDITLSR